MDLSTGTTTKLHPASAGLANYAPVTTHSPPYPLARSSFPNHETTQKFNGLTLPFLHQEGVTHIISLNDDPVANAAIADILCDAKPEIKFAHIPVGDFCAASIEQLRKGYEVYLEAGKGGGKTLVWCLYGVGRTGMLISALQILWMRDRVGGGGKEVVFGRKVYEENGVESEEQMRVLDELQKVIRGEVRDAEDQNEEGI